MATTNNCPDPELLSLHALGALDAGERSVIESHIKTCWKCHSEVMSLGETLGALALSMPLETPPADLKVRVFQAIEQVPSPSVRAHRHFGWPVWSLGLAAALVMVAMGVSRFLPAPSSHYKAIQQAVSDAKRHGARVVSLEGTKDAPKARGEMYVVGSSATGQRVVVAVEGLPEPQGNGVYCLWLLKDGKRSVGGWVTVDKTGKGGLVFDAADQFDAVGVTLEPDSDYNMGPNGQTAPRGPKVLGLPL